MLNKINICNMALSAIGKGNIYSLDDKNEAARQCNLWYDVTRKKVLRDYPWNFALSTTLLASLSATDLRYKYVYAIPVDCIKIISVNNKDLIRYDERPEFDIMLVGGQRAIATNVSGASARYTKDIEDTGIFTPDFVQLLAAALAANIAFILTGNANIQTTQWQMYQMLLQQTMLHSAQENERKLSFCEEYAEARFLEEV